MGKYYTRMKELDHYDHQFGLMIDYAIKNDYLFIDEDENLGFEL